MPRLTKILFRRDTAANWSSTNPTLDSGEAGYDTTNKVLKVGDGTTAWNSLNSFDPMLLYTFRSGLYYYQPSNPSDQNNAAALNELYAVPFPVSVGTTFDRIGIEITVGAATAVVRLGIYTSENGPRPANLVLDAGTIDASTTGSKEIVISQTLTPGFYWLVACLQTATGVSWRTRNNPYFVPPQSTMGNQNQIGWVNTSVTGAFASTYTWTVTQAGRAPKIYLRAQ